MNYFNIGMILKRYNFWFSVWPFDEMLVEISSQSTVDNTIRFDQTNGKKRKVDFKTQTSRLTLQYFF